MNQSSYLSDTSGLSNAFAVAVNLEDYGAGKSAHKPAETAPQQAQATAAFNAAYMTFASQQQYQYQQPAQQAQRAAPPSPQQQPQQQASQAQPAQTGQSQVQQQQQQPAQQPRCRR
jgi:hypothetical protein